MGGDAGASRDDVPVTGLLDSFRLLDMGWRDAVEIAVVAFVLYRLLLLMQGTRAVQMLLGIAVLLVAYAVAWLAKLTALVFLLEILFRYGPFAALVIFHPELRAALAQLGQSRVTRFFRQMSSDEVTDQIAEALDRLRRAGTGAIIAVERDTTLGEYVERGSELQAKVSADLLLTIFTPYSPLHDGAVIVRGDSIVGAGCILPLSQQPLADRSLGTRHRAALGLSEESDATVLVVSEESSVISIAERGTLRRGLTSAQVREALSGRLLPEPAPTLV